MIVSFDENQSIVFIRFDEENNKVYLYDDSGLIDGFPLFTSSNIDINEFGNKKFITFLGDSSELVLYSIN